ncbi:hypothetical protein BOSP111201_20400 [Bordetella sputigena]
MPMVPVQAGPRSDRISPNRLERAAGGDTPEPSQQTGPYAATAWASFWMDSGEQPSASLLTVT